MGGPLTNNSDNSMRILDYRNIIKEYRNDEKAYKQFLNETPGFSSTVKGPTSPAAIQQKEAMFNFLRQRNINLNTFHSKPENKDLSQLGLW